LPGRSGAIRSHCGSLKTLRIKARLLFRTLNQNSKVMGIHPR
jgi:hypothetical protein